ncbi:uncharacterized protein LOC110856165 isoform X2 [Folsomia candida]|uniref:uncharacterized protein LOC110856165 isoform X2 n=1 Tax=Folsomia candida TaxID=158441 RepID=UPI001604D18C|nr:uncharacterized protein LOC110856165 isoform X2 [Folsomia candida]
MYCTTMELYKRNHPYKHRRTLSDNETSGKFSLPEDVAIIKTLNQCRYHHDRLRNCTNCPTDLLERDCGGHYYSFVSGTFKIRTPSRTDHPVSAPGTESTLNENNLKLINMQTSPHSPIIPAREQDHLGFECCGANCLDNNNDDDRNGGGGVETLANSNCDTLLGGRMTTGANTLTEITQSRRSLAAIVTRWKDDFVGRLRLLLSGRSLLARRRRTKSSVLLNTQWTRRMTSFLYTFAILLVTCLSHLPVSYACSSRSTPKPRPPSPTLRPNITIQTYTCPPEYDAHYCLNGATCFTVKIGESILYNCECAEGYMGQRCEFKDLDGSYLPSKQRAMLEQAGVSGAVAIVIILVVIVLGYTYVRQSRRKSLARHTREAGDQVDGFVVERRPFSQYYYNNPSISISQDLHQHQSRSSRGGTLYKVDVPHVSGTSSSPPPKPSGSSSSPTGQVPLHTTKKSTKPPDPPQRLT